HLATWPDAWENDRRQACSYGVPQESLAVRPRRRLRVDSTTDEIDRIQYPLVLMPLLDLLTSSSLGSLLGMRHALEPDHLAAVSTLVTEERSGYKAAMLGAWWGLGHTLALVAAGAVLVALRAEMPARVSDLFEFFVAVMLVALGARAIVQAARQGVDGPIRP